jgi:two-component system, LytTR family, sensor kinase
LLREVAFALCRNINKPDPERNYKLMTKKTVILQHLLIWLIFISYEMTYINFMVGITATVSHYLIFYLLNIGLFYFNAHVILDYSFFRTDKPYSTAIIFTFCELLLYLMVKYGLDLILRLVYPLSPMVLFGRQYVLINVWRGIYFIGFSIAYWSTRYMLKFKERNHTMEKERLKHIADTLQLENRYVIAENAYLKNQISPHLLFNSLNFIYNAVRKLSDEAGRGVMLLSDIMRYSLVSGEDNRTLPLSGEIEQIDKLIELSRLRFQEELFIKFRKKGKFAGIQVQPLILITLVENMLKHGDLGDMTRPALILLEQRGDLLVFVTKNKKRTGDLYPKGGLGLKNIEKRLRNFYEERFELDILDRNDEFSITLILSL